MSQLTYKNISKAFGNKSVIAPLDLSIADGAFLALLGPSGCGKTTLLRMAAGLETPSGGEIWISDRKVYGGDTDISPERRGLGMVFQSYAVWPHMTVEENVSYPLRMRRGSEKLSKDAIHSACEKVLNLVHMTEYRARFPHQLSGGQQQRIALARGLIMQPPVLLLDEPLSNLDARLRAEMRRELRDLHRQLGMTVLYVTHDQREAFEMATQIAVLEDGRIVQQGTPEEIRRSPGGFLSE